MRRNVPKGELDEPKPYVGLEHIPRRSLALDAWERRLNLASNKPEFKKGEILFGKIRPYSTRSASPRSMACAPPTPSLPVPVARTVLRRRRVRFQRCVCRRGERDRQRREDAPRKLRRAGEIPGRDSERQSGREILRAVRRPHRATTGAQPPNPKPPPDARPAAAASAVGADRFERMSEQPTIPSLPVSFTLSAPALP